MDCDLTVQALECEREDYNHCQAKLPDPNCLYMIGRSEENGGDQLDIAAVFAQRP
jgi:hypothetical protein